MSDQDPRVYLHRFRDRCGLSIMRTDCTVYLTASDARALAKGLNAIARSIERVEFSQSKGLDLSVPAKDDTSW
jgi:hypothetical protein